MTKAFLLAFAIFALLTGCATPVLFSPPGYIYNSTTNGLQATSNQAGSRVGEACANSVLGLVATGDSSIETARRNGGITMISSIDQKVESVLFFYAKYCTVVRGR